MTKRLRLISAALMLLAAGLLWTIYGRLPTTAARADEPTKTAAVRAKAAPAAAADPALERTRKTVRMLDDVYKTAVVLITEHYVKGKDELPAGSAAIALFDAIKKKGWHEVRLLDATGQPYEDKNSPRDDFEKAAVEQLRSGKSYHEQVVERDSQRFLRAATPIPVVHKKCVMCHEHYKDAKPGEAIGALSYTIKIE
jgi:hypothetical protein